MVYIWDATQQKRIKIADDFAANGVPIGTVISSFSEVTPQGYLPFKGNTYNKSDYPELFSKLPSICKLVVPGTNDNPNPETTQFRLPDLTGRVIQGADTSNIGDLIEAGLPNITGDFVQVQTDAASDYPVGTGALKQTYKKDNTGGGNGTNRRYNLVFNAADGETDTDGNLKTVESEKVYGKSNTVQPPAFGLYYYVKATNYIDISKNAIDDTAATNANVWSAEKTKQEIDQRGTYSAEEVVIGTYLDKPHYRIVLPAKTITTSWQQITTAGNIMLLTRIDVVLGNANRCAAILQRKVENNNVYVARYNDENITNNGIILEYTKTTD